MSSVAVNYKWITDRLLKEFSEIPDVENVMIIDNQGNLLEYVSNSSFEEQHPLSELRYIAKLISLRYKIADFHKILDGLQLTIDVFSDNIMIVTSVGEMFLSVIANKEIDLKKTIELLKSSS